MPPKQITQSIYSRMKFSIRTYIHIFGVILVAALCLITTSCASRKDVVYLQDASIGSQSQYSIPVLRIAKGDMLGITVNSKNRELSDPFNLPMVGYYSAFGISASNTQQGYMVDDEGYIDFPALGRVHVEGLTRNELNTKIATALRDKGFLNDATVTISLLNAQISVLGEVARPGSFPMVSDQVSLLDAIAMAGDLTIQGRRDNVLVIREIDGERYIVAHDLRSNKIFESPCYFLRQGDIVYVEPNDAKAQTASINPNNNVGTWLSVVSTATSLTTFVFTIIASQKR